MPFESLYLILKKSSRKTMMVKPDVIKRQTQIYLLPKSAHNKVVISYEEIISNPPMVGVPDFCLWESGPLSTPYCLNCIL